MDSRSTLLLTLALAAVVSAVAAFTTVRMSGTESPPISAVPPDLAIDDLEARIARIESRLGDADAAPAVGMRGAGESAAQPRTVPGRSERTLDPGSLAALEVRIRALEATEAERQQAVEDRDAEQLRRRAERELERAQRAEAAAVTMLSPAASEAEKAEAWGALRSSADAHWNDAIVAEAIRIGTTSTDGATRADIWRQADANATSPLLVQPMIQALLYDDHTSAREEAAETLQNYRDDPRVVDALRHAGENDADEGVRRQAGQSLSGR